MRALVTGSRGGLGTYVVRALEAAGYDVLDPPRTELDFTDREGVDLYLGALRPAVIIHLAALADVDRCGTHLEEAVRANVLATQYLVASARCPLVYMSTNDVFSECLDGPFDEGRTPAPGMPYSWSKFAGEQAVLAVGGLVVRANFFTRRCNSKRSFVAYVLEHAVRGVPFDCYTNVCTCPVFAGTLATVLVRSSTEDCRGVLHVATEDAVNRAEQAEKICEAYGLSSLGVRPVPLRDRCGRPLDARLTSVRGGIVGTVSSEIQKLVQAEPIEDQENTSSAT